MLVHCRVTLATRSRRQLSCNCYLQAFSQPIRQILWSAIRLSVVNPKPTKDITTTNKKKRRTLQEGDKNVKTSYLLEAGKTYVTRFSKQIIQRAKATLKQIQITFDSQLKIPLSAINDCSKTKTIQKKDIPPFVQLSLIPARNSRR